jgi:hypothetical protein
LAQAPEDGPSRRIGQRLEDTVQLPRIPIHAGMVAGENT